MTGRNESQSEFAATRRAPITSASMDPDNNEYATPPEIWRPISRAVGGFDLDPCSGAESEAIASERFTVEDDGLSKPWTGHVFVNPPWSTNGDGSAKVRWLEKAWSEVRRPAVETVTVLLPSDTSSSWFHEHVLAAPVICFVGPGRISFEGGDKNPSFGLTIVVYGNPTPEIVDALDNLGATFEGRSIYDPLPQQTLGGGPE